MFRWHQFFIGLCMALAAVARADIVVMDATGQRVELKQPATRIISLAPHTTELLFAAGAGDKIIAVGRYSNYPEAATHLPQIGDAYALDIERIVKLHPDLIVAWASGTPAPQLELLRQLNIPLYLSNPRKLDQIANEISYLGDLTNSAATAKKTAADMTTRLNTMRKHTSGKTPKTVFFAIWSQPLMTINHDHLINDIIELCGGANLFADLPALTPTVDREMVIRSNPDAIVTGVTEGDNHGWQEGWRKWPTLRAVSGNGLIEVDADLISRATPRALLGAEDLCRKLDNIH